MMFRPPRHAFNRKHLFMAYTLDCLIALGAGILIGYLVFSCTPAQADSYTVTNPYNPMQQQTVHIDSHGNGYVYDTFNPMNRRNITTMGDTVIVEDPFDPMNRREIRVHGGWPK